jgi:hypothetical protein
MLRTKKMIAGMEKHLADISLPLSGRMRGTAEVVAALKKRIDAAAASEAAHAAWLAKVAEERAALDETKELLANLQRVVIAMFGSMIETLADFGIAPRKKRAPLSPEAMVLSAERARATRAARHTMGPKQRLAIKADVPQVPEPASKPQSNPVPLNGSAEGPPPISIGLTLTS